MCNCIEEIEKRYKEHLKENDSTFKDIEDFNVNFINKAYMFDSGKIEVGLPLEIEWKHIAKSCRVSVKRKEINFTIKYCPFCGEEIKRTRGTE